MGRGPSLTARGLDNSEAGWGFSYVELVPVTSAMEHTQLLCPCTWYATETLGVNDRECQDVKYSLTRTSHSNH